MQHQDFAQIEKRGPCPHVGYRLSALKSSSVEKSSSSRIASRCNGSSLYSRFDSSPVFHQNSSKSYSPNVHNFEPITKVTHPLSILERILQIEYFDSPIDIPSKSFPYQELLEFESFSLISPTKSMKDFGSNQSYRDVLHGAAYSPRTKLQRQQEILATEELLKEMFKERDREFFWLDDLKKWVPRQGFDENWEYFSFVKGADLIARYSSLTGKNLEHLQRTLNEREKLFDQQKLDRLRRIKEHRTAGPTFKLKPRVTFTAPPIRRENYQTDSAPSIKPPPKPKDVFPPAKPLVKTPIIKQRPTEPICEVSKPTTALPAKQVAFETEKEIPKRYERTEEFTARKSTAPQSTIFKKSSNKTVRQRSTDSVKKTPRQPAPPNQPKIVKTKPPAAVLKKVEIPDTSFEEVAEEVIDHDEPDAPSSQDSTHIKRRSVEKKQRVFLTPKKPTPILQPVTPEPEPLVVEDSKPLEEEVTIPDLPEVKIIEIPSLPPLPTIEPKPISQDKPQPKKLRPLLVGTSTIEVEEAEPKKVLSRPPSGGAHLLALKRQKLEEALREKFRTRRRLSGDSQISEIEPNFDDYDFLARYTVLTEDRVEKAKQIYFKICSEEKPWLNMKETLEALHHSNPSLRESEKEYLCRILQIFNYRIENGTDFRLFAVLSSLADKITILDEWMRLAISQIDYKLLEMRSSLCRNLWEVNVDHESNTIPLQQLCVELVAGGVSEEHVENVCRKLGWFYALDLLDFLTYIPLFITLHNAILNNPLDDKRDL